MGFSQKNNLSLHFIPWATVGLVVFILLVSLIFYRDWQFACGLISGAILAAANFVFLTKVVAKVLDENYKRKPLLGILFLLKFLAVIGVMVSALGILGASPVGFVLGYLVLVPVILFWQFFGRSDRAIISRKL